MIIIKDKHNCCGCAACVQRCPKQCISMKEDEEGFLYPHVDAETCIDCGLCEKVCPVINQAEPKEPLKVYAAKNKDLQKRELSSSGGLFIALAEKVIEKGGVVFGVVFDENWEAHHVAATTLEELEPMMRSKYMQSRVENTFAEAEKYLKEGREVMYTGTPCQIAGLKKYLRKEYDNLIAVDIVCHGVPSIKIWREYKKTLKCDIADISFRAKQSEGFSWRHYGFVVKDKEKNAYVSETATQNLYLKGYSCNLFLRPSCHYCPSKSCKSNSDLTLGDYWGIWNYNAGFDDDKGSSMILVNSQIGYAILEKLNIEVEESDYEKAVKGNPMLVQSTPASPLRERFFQLFEQKGLVHLDETIKSLKPSFAKRVINRILRTVKR